MKAEFYDVKARAKVEAEVIDKIVYADGTKQRFALKAKTADGRGLTKFVNKETFDSVKL